MKEDQKDQGFVFKDSRKISLDDAQTEPEAATAKEAETRSDGASEESRTPVEDTPPQNDDSGTDSMPLPEVNFSTFIFSLSSSALVHLGEIPEPVSRRMHQDLGLAKQIIDTLGMIEEKTRSNLDADEDRLIKGVLYDLRMRFVQKSK